MKLTGTVDMSIQKCMVIDFFQQLATLLGVMILSRPVDRIQTTGCVRESQEVLLAPNIACCTGFTLRADPTASFSAPDATFAHTSTSELGFWSRATRDEEIASRSPPSPPVTPLPTRHPDLRTPCVRLRAAS